MKLSPSDKDLYYKLYPSLMAWVNNKFKIIPDCKSSKNFIQDIDHQERMEIRDKLFDSSSNNKKLITEFIRSNPDDLLLNELSIIKSWVNAIFGEFFIFRHLKKHTIFLESSDSPKAYGVLGIETELPDLVPNTPTMVKTTLLPFKGQIIYDGLLAGYSMSFGRGIQRSLNEAYNKAKSRPGIITSFDQLLVDPEKQDSTDEDKLRYFLKNQSNRDYYQIDIENLIKKDRRLAVIYHQLIGKISSKSIGKRLKELGMSPGWYAILEDIVIASGESKEEVVRLAMKMVPIEKDEFVYYYQMRKYKQK
jgi:hypothetical protein